MPFSESTMFRVKQPMAGKSSLHDYNRQVGEVMVHVNHHPGWTSQKTQSDSYT